MSIFGWTIVRSKTYDALHAHCARLERRVAKADRRAEAQRISRANRAIDKSSTTTETQQ